MFDFPNSPSVGQQIVEPNGSVAQWDGVKWNNVAGQVNSVAPAYNNVGRNLLHNPLFNIQQRGAGPWAGGYTADRWAYFFSLDTASTVSIAALVDTQRTMIGDEAAIYSLIASFTGNAGAGAYSVLQQRIEDVRRLAGKTITVSFWAWCGSGSLKLGISPEQAFGTGGSPSSTVSGNGQSVTLSTTPTRYSVTFAIPSVIGKVLGTGNDHFTDVAFWFSSGANNALRSGNIGVQSGAIGLWGMQLEIGTTTTPLEKPDQQQDLAKCQRFFQGCAVHTIGGASLNGATMYLRYVFPVPMRVSPIITWTVNAGSGYSGPVVSSSSTDGFTGSLMGTGPSYIANSTFTASADL